MQMVKAIKSGDLSGAQQAYATLDQMQSSGQIAAPDPNSPFAAALKQIGQSLQNGDLAGAQQTLASLGQHVHGHHHHHHADSDTSQSSAPVANGANGDGTAPTTTVGSTVDVAA
jgi:hypothetical protein